MQSLQTQRLITQALDTFKEVCKRKTSQSLSVS